MSRKKKVSRGNPAKAPRRPVHPPHGVEDAIRRWGDDLMCTHPDDELAVIATAVTGWVGVGNPGGRGLNQCLDACHQVRTILQWCGVQSVITAVMLEVTGTHARTVGTLAPRLSDDGLSWSGHAVLFIPAQGRVLDPTIGQQLPKSAAAGDLAPFVGRIAGSVGQPDEDPLGHVLDPGTQWAVPRGSSVARYTVLDRQYDPTSLPIIQERFAHNEREMAGFRGPFEEQFHGIVETRAKMRARGGFAMTGGSAQMGEHGGKGRR